MTTTFFFVRHAAHDRVGTILCGRMQGVSLGPLGRSQAESVSARLADENISVVLTSPLDRARETAEPIGAKIGCQVEICEAINEIEFGEWSGQSFDTLAGDPRWNTWNQSRSTSRPPGGETMLEVQTRVVSALEQLRRDHPGGSLAVVSHGDVIKSALLYYLGMPIDAYSRFDIDPASISTVAVSDWGSKVIRLNESAAA
ncbi:histidine phosphatase family protein [Microvirga subterranea]|uniref:Putative phosphoglycerate mutase n=1 Tax=Microvirga subterranea TaxID=186651 RepID=A0A370HLD6_9HYPH|nr:histidine phosphatase family protein [Microvirga subterranea]RDI59328.1 putative phosphoglycerate mutase [Microvirga subterranea]